MNAYLCNSETIKLLKTMAFDYLMSAMQRTASVCRREDFDRIVKSKTVSDVAALLADARERQLRGEMSREDYDTYKAKQKLRLPVFCFASHFTDGQRHNSSAVPSGLAMLDVDHVSEAGQAVEGSLAATLIGHVLRREVVADEQVIDRLRQLGIVLLHITPSGDGLRIVFVMPGGMDIVAAQQWMAQAIGLRGFDEACKDPARCSFAVPLGYLLYADYGQLFADRPVPPAAPVQCAAAPVQYAAALQQPTATAAAVKDSRDGHDSSNSREGNAGEEALPENIRLFEAAVREIGLNVASLDMPRFRHNNLMAVLSTGIARLMPETQMMAVVKRYFPQGYAKADNNVRRLVSDFYSKYTDASRPMSRRLQKLYTTLQNDCADRAAAADAEAAAAEADTADDAADRAFQLRTVKVLLRSPMALRSTLAMFPRDMWMPVLCSLLPLMGAYADGVTVKYCDNSLQRLGLMSIIVGPQASGKAACTNAVNLWLKAMEDDDARGREVEDKWKEEKMLRRANDRGIADPKPLIRVLPITVSNATLLHRLKLSRGHTLYSFGEELDTLRKTNTAGNWSAKYDIYRSAFDYGKWGQDYKSDTSESGIVNVAYNWTCLGTYGALRKCFQSDNVENGLSSRMIIAEMPDTLFSPMPVYKQPTAEDLAMISQAVAILRNATGFMDTPRLRRVMRQWVEDKRLSADQANDRVAATYRKRAAVIGFRAGAIARIIEGVERQSVLDLATLVADYVCDEQCRLFGDMLAQAFADNDAAGNGNFQPKANIYSSLPDVFTLDDLAKRKMQGTSVRALRAMVYRWKKNKWIEKTGNNQWTKTN